MWQWISGVDNYFTNIVQSIINTNMTSIMKNLSLVGSYKGYVFICIFLLVLSFRYRKIAYEIYFVIFGLITSALLNEGLKICFNRARPDNIRLVNETGLSFPSGHAMNSMVFYMLIAIFVINYVRVDSLKRHDFFKRIFLYLIIFVCILMPFFIGVSRIYLGVHYPSDVIGGYIFGVIWVATLFALKRYKKAT